MRYAFRLIVVLAVLAGCWDAFAQDKPAKPNIWPLVDQAAGFIKEGKLDKAEEAAAMVLETDPSQPMGYALMICIIEKKKEYDAAVIALCDALMKAQPVDETVKKPDPLRHHQLWHYYANRHKGEALMRQKKYAEAAACFQTAADMAYQAARPMDAKQTRRWQIRMKNRQADALWEAGKKDEAVAVRQQILQRHDGDPRGCNNCVRVKAALMQNLKALGKADEAKKMLDAALADKRLDKFQKSCIKSPDAMIDYRDLQGFAAFEEIGEQLVTSNAPDAFVIRSEGRFELRVNLAGKDRYGMITQWYDLLNDPLREVDLQDDNFFTMLKPHHVGYQELVDGEWKGVLYNRYVQLRKAGKLGVGYTKEQNAFEVLEKTPARVRFRYTNRSWPGETATTTVYPDGRIYTGFHWTLNNPDKTIKINRLGYYTGVSGTVNWRATIGEKTGMFGSPYISGQAPFTMMHSNEHYPTALETTHADFAKCLVRPTGSYGNNTLFLAWFRTPVQARYKPDEQAEAHEAVFMHIWPNDRNSYEAELPYIQDYQSPAKLTVAKGKLVTDDPGDYNKDGFNEAEGCYVVRADGNAVELTIDGSKVARYSPVIKVKDLKAKGIGVTLGGKMAKAGRGVTTHCDAETGVAIVRLLGKIDRSVRVGIVGK